MTSERIESLFLPSLSLQCGRIHKDAEIVYSFLQCGRIHKDAEIWTDYTIGTDITLNLQCGRIHKDAEIVVRECDQFRLLPSFNVAASIKMRKFPAYSYDAVTWLCPSMWPHP